MHWYWIDKFITFESGKRAQAVKLVSRAESHLADHFPDYPVMPASLVIEGLAQTGGLLIHESFNFTKNVVLGKIQKLHFYQEEIVPGDLLVYEAIIEYVRDEGSMTSVSVHRKGDLIAEGILVFAHLDFNFSRQEFFAEHDLQNLVRAYGMYDIGVRADGTPIPDPILQKK